MPLPDDRPPQAAPGPTDAPSVCGSAAPRAVRSEALFGGATEVQIEHRGTLYRLRQTALGKLILTK